MSFNAKIYYDVYYIDMYIDYQASLHEQLQAYTRTHTCPYLRPN